MSLKARHPHFRAREAGLGTGGAGNGECEDGKIFEVCKNEIDGW